MEFLAGIRVGGEDGGGSCWKVAMVFWSMCWEVSWGWDSAFSDDEDDLEDEPEAGAGEPEEEVIEDVELWSRDVIII